MKKIYLWEIPEDYPEELIGKYEQEYSPDRFLFRQGEPLLSIQVASSPIIKFEAYEKDVSKFDCLQNSSAIPLVNERLANLIVGQANKDIQLFDVKVKCIDGDLEGYKILNVTHAMKGIDHELSSYTKMKQADAILGFKSLVYKNGCMGEHQLARDEEYKGHLLVGQKIHDAFKTHNVTGVWLVTPEEFYDLVHDRQ